MTEVGDAVTDPISVRVARLKGCDPLPSKTEEGRWLCTCATPWPHGVDSGPFRFVLLDYTSPSAAFALLSEMVDGAPGTVELYHDSDGYHLYVIDVHDYVSAVSLGEAICEAWCAWKEAAR